ncbi:hypothetical protein [Pseudomonas sp. NPDC089406]|uniref:hypothetical protein n=1 Tax=Pseudomonas sp. NPDC089406 TaxID=3364463 RepID=UPI003850E3EA
MKKESIAIEINENRKNVTLKYELDPPKMVLEVDEKISIAEGRSLIHCLASLREQNPHIKFLCKGSKLNVYFSRMSMQMSSGMLAYELTLGEYALIKDIVNIFDYDDSNIAQSFEQQKAFFETWLESLEQGQ